MQNKPNLLNTQINVRSAITMDYVNLHLRSRFKNKANTKPNKANLLNAQMNVSSALIKDYENDNTFRLPENKPNSKPIKPNTNPIPERPEWM